MTKENVNNKLKEVQFKSSHMRRSKDKGMINKESKASMGMKDNGSTSIAAGEYAQYKLDKETGIANEISLHSNTTTVVKNIKANDITVNKHKLNNQLWELTDYKQKGEYAIGGMTMVGTVMVKAWEPTLKKYVMIRRQARIPVFSNLLNVPSSPQQYGIDENIAKDIKEYMIKSDNKEEN